MEEKSKAGLEDLVVASSSICDLNGERNSVELRGYDLLDLAEQSNFEEVCHLLWYNKLPSSTELKQLTQTMIEERTVPSGLAELIGRLPKTSMMDALRTLVSALAAYDPEPDNVTLEATLRRTVRITATMPMIIATAYRTSHGLQVIAPHPHMNHAQNFLHMILGRELDHSLSRTFEKSMILYSEHELNASTFSARITSSTLSDIYSAITSAIGTLKGPLHGGANEEAMKLLLSVGTVDRAEEYVRNMLADGKKVMGFGHRVYKSGDPRVKLMKRLSRQVGEETGQLKWHEICEKVEKVLATEKKLYPNLDFYSAPTYYCLGIPIDLYTPIFAASRIAGWSAHVLEQLGNNRLIRPRAEYVGPRGLKYTPLTRRT